MNIKITNTATCFCRGGQPLKSFVSIFYLQSSNKWSTNGEGNQLTRQSESISCSVLSNNKSINMKNIPELSWLIWSHHYDMFVQSNNPVYCARLQLSLVFTFVSILSSGQLRSTEKSIVCQWRISCGVFGFK